MEKSKYIFVIIWNTIVSLILFMLIIAYYLNYNIDYENERLINENKTQIDIINYTIDNILKSKNDTITVINNINIK